MTYDAYLDVEGIPGEATASGFEKKIGIYSFSLGAASPAAVSPGKGGLSSGRVTLSEFNLMKQKDSASVPLFLACCQGKHIPKVTLTLRKATGDAQEGFLVYKFEDVMVSSYQVSGSSNSDESPTESISLAFVKIEMEYKTQGKDGKLVAAGQGSWDQSQVKS